MRDGALAEGRRDGAEQAATLLVEAEARRARRLDELEAEIPSLVVAIARRVLGRELAAAGAVVDVVAETLAPLRARREVTIRVAPADLPAVMAARPRLAALVERATLELLADARVEPGGCVVDTELGRVDARLETQLARIEAALAELV
jgi:flagellar biosynthesis/type III secretory pathway protein FliH